VFGLGDLAGYPLKDLSPPCAILIRGIVQHVVHELRLQFLGTTFSTSLQRSLGLGEFLTPGSKIEDGRFVLFD
jgi:hypothetical protein